MIKKRISLFLVICFSYSVQELFSQQHDPNNPSNTFQSKDNPYYWKNRKPFEGYWQQDVYYKINAKLDDKTNIVDASEELTYWNNSPDELTFVYFHLYNNAQVKGSYLSDLYQNNEIKVRYGKYQQEKKGTEINKISIDGNDVKTELDNTILKVWLPKPLKTGESITLKIDFKTYFDNGTIRNRMKMLNAYGYKHYNLVHWYPRISVYDRKMGWDTDQHMDHEFYGDFGTYEVTIAFPNNYVVDATGNLLNRDEVLPADLRQKLDIKNFKDKPWNSAPSEIIKPDGSTKTWKFYAENVHDFALTADPTYRIGEAEWNGIKCIALAQEPHASRWQNAAEYTAKVIQVNSEDFGMYAYPKMIVADAQDGMEYPMLTLDGGEDPEYRGLLAHEVSHNWFFGMIGNNETYRAFMDEGFTQFLTAWDLEKIDGLYKVKKPLKSKYAEKFTQPELVRNNTVYNRYIADAIRGDETTLNTHSDGFKGAVAHGGGYSQVYFKTATMLYNLQSVLGDELFLKAMQHYFDQWKICHPYPEDFRNSIIQFTHVDLNWFFDQWIETSKTIDYAIVSVKKVKDKSHNQKDDSLKNYLITFKRIGKMQAPIDFEVITDDSAVYSYHIPNTWFEKKTNATILPRWIGWDKVQTTYEANITIQGELSNVVIDPTNRLADANMLNNSFELPVEYYFDSRIYNSPDWRKYQVYARPDIWYNGYDGFKVGANVNGNYMNYMHLFDATIWYNTGLLQNNVAPAAEKKRFDIVNFRINYSTALDKFMKNSTIRFSIKSLEGLNAYMGGYERKSNSGKSMLLVYAKSMQRVNKEDLNYLLYPNEWQVNKLNNTLNMVLEHNYTYKHGTGNIRLISRTSSVASDYNYSSLSLTAINKNNLGKININTRTFIQYGTGNNWADESSLYLAGANPEELMDNKYTRSQGFFDPSWAGYGANTNYFQAGGGLNLRGYSGYLAPQKDADGNTFYTYKGTSGAAINAEIEMDKIFKLDRSFIRNTFKFTPYLFGDAGVINYNNTGKNLLLSNIRTDAGIGCTLGIVKWGPLQKVNPLIIRFDAPLFLNRAPATDNSYIKFRWVIGINRAF